MSYKRHWDYNKDGCVELFRSENSACEALEIDALKLSAGQSFTSQTGEYEYVFTILSGVCSIEGGSFSFESVGKRMSVFEGKAYALYLPRRVDYTIKAETDLKIIMARCEASNDHKVKLITPEDIVVKNLGKPGFEREAHFLVDERMECDRIYVGENFIRGGQWSSFPGHKHDENNMPNEGFAEEIYYYEYDKDTGYGIQQVYTADRELDEAYAVRNGDIVEIPRGYHPCCVAPGYTGYLLWMMSCDNRGFFLTLDPEQEWQTK
ncbi:MAG: 5-deoxy-glucuronate isomerase [Clostridiales bacterium]|nr:5-deoxy-glucuronate isomerase [Clostridiales bacterium]